MKKKIRIVIVDDSAFMRKSLSILIGSDPDMDIVGIAKDGLEGYNLAKKLRPDVVTLDIEMPVMDGLSALKKIMSDCPTSVIMVSSLTTEGADSTLKALELGAVDFIPKEMSYVNINIGSIRDDLIKKIKAIVQQKNIQNTLTRLQKITRRTSEFKTTTAVTPSKLPPKIGYKAVALGISTGGPLSLQKVIPLLSLDKFKVPMFIVQHMPPKFTKSLSDRLNEMSEVTVKEAEDGEPVKAGHVYIAPGGFHMHVRKNGPGNVRIIINDQPAGTLHKPSVDVMLASVLEVYGKYTLGIIMTGMGRDGADGIKELKKLGGYAIAQNEETCVVYGMPKAIVDEKLADTVLPLTKIGESINQVL
jgi:two-component system chemotaxis response regulator CheB